MIKGKYVAQIEIDILVDENTPNLLPFDQLKNAVHKPDRLLVIASVPQISVNLPHILHTERSVKVLIYTIQEENMKGCIVYCTAEWRGFTGRAGKPFQHLALYIQFALASADIEIHVRLLVGDKFSLGIDEPSRETYSQSFYDCPVSHPAHPPPGRATAGNWLLRYRPV